MRIASWNVNSLKVRLPHVEQWCRGAQPDVLALQETKLGDDKFPREAIEALGYQAAFSGQKTYNGVAILARGPLTDVVAGVPGFGDPQRRVLAATVGGVRIVNLYVVNGQSVGSEKYIWKLEWLAMVTEYLRAELQRHGKVVVLGDFNIAPDDRDVHDPDAWRGQILCSEPERAALGTILNLGFVDSFRAFVEDPGHFSWWDYRQAAFRRNLGLRIDLILASGALRESMTAVSIDRTPRTWERPSDHTPVILDLDERAAA
ncbi:MAG TPA: exodeoxyribonuclease III [Rhodanobacteraceae bacterium]|jgi:exodeoxyribonuclease-3|nr:exodeoxyribonuclease III [Rhodanobacteraceae bacterium]